MIDLDGVDVERIKNMRHHSYKLAPKSYLKGTKWMNHHPTKELLAS